MLEAGIGRVDVGCCWLLLIADGCYWLQLIAASCCWLLDDCWLRLGYYWLLLVAAGCCWLLLVAAGCCWLLDDAGCGWNTACRRKSLWIFSGYWWLAAKTFLQATKTLNNFGTLMVCGKGNSAGGKVFDNFRRRDEEVWLRQILEMSLNFFCWRRKNCTKSRPKKDLGIICKKDWKGNGRKYF